MSPSAVWPSLAYRDARAAIAFLVDAFGFEELGVYGRENDSSIVEHAELRWPLGGGIMLATAERDDSPFGRRAPGAGALFVMCNDPDGLYVRATGAGAIVLSPLTEEDCGSRGFTVTDLEGNLWRFGTHRGG